MKKWIICSIILGLLIDAIHAQWWDSEDALRSSKEYFDSISEKDFDELSTTELVEAYTYHSVHYIDVSPTALDVLNELAFRSDLEPDHILVTMADIPIIASVESVYLSDSSMWALVGLKDLAEEMDMLDPDQEPRAAELMMGFVARAIEFTVRNDAAENFLLTATVGTLHRGGWLGFDPPDDRNAVRPFVQSFLDHYGITATMQRPEGW